MGLDRIYGFSHIFFRTFANQIKINVKDIKPDDELLILNKMFGNLLEIIKAFIFDKEMMPKIKNVRIIVTDELASANMRIEGEVIYIDLKLMKLIGDITILISHMVFTLKDDEKEESYAALLKRIVNRNMLYFEYGESFYSVFESPVPFNSLVTEKANAISMAVILYILCHELAHFMLKNDGVSLDNKAKKAAELDNYRFKAYYHEFEDNNLNRLVEEFAADVKATQLYFELLFASPDIKKLTLDPITVGWAPIYYFYMLDALDASDRRFNSRRVVHIR